jgi:hypothetical protein
MQPIELTKKKAGRRMVSVECSQELDSPMMPLGGTLRLHGAFCLNRAAQGFRHKNLNVDGRAGEQEMDGPDSPGLPGNNASKPGLSPRCRVAGTPREPVDDPVIERSGLAAGIRQDAMMGILRLESYQVEHPD